MTGPAVHVLIPYRPDGTDRARAVRFVVGWWAEHHPDWVVRVCPAPPGPWCKAAAVTPAARQSAATILIVADADVFADPAEVTNTVRHVAGGSAAWASPHRQVVRLNRDGTAQVLAGGPLPTPTVRRTTDLIAEQHRGVLGGGLVVLRREVYLRVPLDPRFQGWGQEDESWGRALAVVGGPWWRGTGLLYHLWHPAARRANRTVGNPDGWALKDRYLAASGPAEMTALLGEMPDLPGTVRGMR